MNKCHDCYGKGWIAFSEFEVAKCYSCNGEGVLCDHIQIQPCVACISDEYLEWYCANPPETYILLK